MKIIFLDIDGVLNSDSFYQMRHRCFENGIPFPVNWPVCEIDPDAVAVLNRIIKETDARIVLTSTWRIGETLDSLSNIMKTVGVEGTVIGATNTSVDEETTNRHILYELNQKWVGQSVSKVSEKPFKFGGKVGTVDEVHLVHPYHNKVMSFKIREDGTFVEAWRCRNVDTGEEGPLNINELDFRDKKARGIEIAEWLGHATVDVESYVILDDDNDMLGAQAENFVHINRHSGLTDQDADKIVKVLNTNI